AGLVAARLLHRAQLLEECGAVGLTVGWRVGLAADDEPEFALLEVDGSCAWLRLPSAGTARRRDHHRLAGRTLMQLRCLATVALNLRRVDRTPVNVERPLDMILGQAMPVDGAAVVENDGVRLAFRGAQNSPNHLSEQSKLLGRTSKDQTVNGRHIPALGHTAQLVTISVS